MTDCTTTVSIVNLNVSSLSMPVKQQRLSEWIKKQIQHLAMYKNQCEI